MGLAGWQGGRGGLLVLCPLFREGLAYRSGLFNRREMPKIDGKGEGALFWVISEIDPETDRVQFI